MLFRSTRGSKGGCTYRVSATYRYMVDGVAYTADRVSLHSGSDSIGNFHQRTYCELKRRQDKREDISCWVNPENPADAILIRKPRLEMLLFTQLFVLSLGSVGLGIVTTGLSRLAEPSAEALSMQGRIRMRGTSSHRAAGAIALVWNGYVAWLLWRAYVVMAPEPLPWWLWLAAPTGLVPAVIAGYLIGRFRKFGVSVFEMTPIPGVIGEPLTGTIRVPAQVETDAGFDVKLTCVHQYTTGSGKHSSTHRDVRWEQTLHIDGGGQTFGEETILPVRFSPPHGLPATTAAGGNNGYYWQLGAKCAAPGIDYKAIFDVPMRNA